MAESGNFYFSLRLFLGPIFEYAGGGGYERQIWRLISADLKIENTASKLII